MTQDPPREPAPDEPAAGGAQPTPAELAAAVRARRRAVPRYRVFIGLGVLVGVVAALVLTSVVQLPVDALGGSTTGQTNPEQYDGRAVLGYTALVLALAGGLLGGGLAVLLDRRR